eukprot:GHVP01033497.1.p1 GENE.GHVP01033497.1~~GHVP01033497.1.p1  ORF type:complete len:284 (+),score=35.36 GHVP01033497.1:317-1168(+)
MGVINSVEEQDSHQTGAISSSLLSTVSPSKENENHLPLSAIQNDVQLPVHLGTLSVPTEVTSRSLAEARNRHFLSLSNQQKCEGYTLWLKTMLSLNKIEPANNFEEVSYFGPAVLVPKPNKSIRVTHDYSGLKQHTSLFRFDQNKIETIWTWASQKSFLIKLDFVKAFHAVEIDERDKKFYGFIGPDDHPYVYTVLPMGTRNSPALFAEFVGRSLKDLILKYPGNIMTYQDDVAVASNDPASTIKIAKLASDLLLLNGLVENKEKSHWNPVDPKPLLGAIWSP